MGVYTNFEAAVMQSVMAAVSSTQPAVSSIAMKPIALGWNGTGFGGQVRVGTAFGDRPIERLRVGDDIRTSSGRLARIQWIDKLHLDEEFLTKNPSAQPICIQANAFGAGRPMQDMMVSPQQEVSADALVASGFKTAIDLCSQARAHRVQTAALTYYRFHCGEPTEVRVEGLCVRVLP